MEISEQSVVVFTEPINDMGVDISDYFKIFAEIVCGYSGEIILKRHPRDSMVYSFPEGIIKEIPRNIPAEIIFPFLKGNRCFMMLTNSLIIEMRKYNLRPVLVFSETCYKELQKIRPLFSDREESERELSNWLNDYEIIDV